MTGSGLVEGDMLAVLNTYREENVLSQIKNTLCRKTLFAMKPPVQVTNKCATGIVNFRSFTGVFRLVNKKFMGMHEMNLELWQAEAPD